MQRNLTLLLTLAVLGAVAAVGWLLLDGGLGFEGASLDRSRAGTDAEGRPLLDPDAPSLRAAPDSAMQPTEEELEALRKAAEAPAFARSEGVFGTVTNGAGDAIPSALVKLIPRETNFWWNRLEPDPPPLATSLTGEDGAFLVGPAPEGKLLRLRVEAPGYAPSVKSLRARGYRVDVVLDRGGSLDVTVKGREGERIAGARVLHSVGNWMGMVVTEAVTNEDGLAVFPNLPTGSGSLLVSAEGHASMQQGGVGVAPGKAEQQTIVLPQPLVVEGRVLADGSDLPLAGAAVRVLYPQQPWLDPSDTVVTDDAGHYEVTALAPIGQQVTFEVEAPDRPMITVYQQLQEADERRMTFDIRVPAERGGFAGRVVDSLGRPTPGATVTYPYFQPGQDPVETRTGPDGRFELESPSWLQGRNRGAQIVAVADGEGIGVAYARLPKEDEAPKPVEIRLSGMGRVGGKVVDGAGVPVEGALVLLEVDWQLARATNNQMDWGLMSAAQNPRLTRLDAVTDAAGAFAIEDVPTMAFRLTVSSGLNTIIDPEPVRVEAGQQINRNVVLGEGMTIEGTVRDGEGRAIAGALVNASPAGQRGGMGTTSKMLSGRSQSDGHFVLHGATDAEYRLYAQAAGYRSERADTVTGGTIDVELTLIGLGWVDGRVELDGRGYAGTFTVMANPVKDSGARRPQQVWTPGMGGWQPGGGLSNTFSPDDGTFHLQGLRSGEYDLTVRTPEGWISAGPFRVGVADGRGSEAVLTLSQGSVIKGRLVGDETNEPIANANVYATGRPGSQGPMPSASARTDAEGRYLLRGLGSGPYVVRVTPPSGVPFQRTVDLGVGEERTLDLREEPPGGIRTLVVDENGNALPGVQIQISNAAGQMVWPNWTALQKEGMQFTANTWNELRQTDGNGTNLWRHLAPGGYRITVVATPSETGRSWRSKEPVDVQVFAGRTAQATVVVEEVEAPRPPARR